MTGPTLKSFLSIPFSAQGNPVLWFLYTIFGLYLITPILDAWLIHATRRHIEAVLCLWFVSLCVPLLGECLYVDDGNGSMLYYFSGYAGYYLLGYYLHRYPDALALRRLWPLTFIAVIAPIITRLMSWQVDFYKFFWYLSPFVAIMAATIWKIVMRLTRHLSSTHRMTLFSGLTFGIYLSQMLVMRYWFETLPCISGISPYPLRATCVAVATFVMCGILAYLLSLVPGAGYLVGAHNRLHLRK